jgi:hypothetical protein
MTRTQRAGWVLLAAGIALLLVIIGIQAWTGKDFLTLTLTVPVSIITAALALLAYGYKDMVTSAKDGKEA